MSSEGALQRAQRAERAFKALSECNQALICAQEEAALLQEICRIIVDVCGYRLCWVGFTEQNKAKTVRPVAQAGYEEGYLETVKITWADTERGRGPTGTAIRTGEPSICRNMLTDPKYTPWRVEATKRGYASSVALPLIANDTCFGTINIYAPEPDAFDQKEVKLLKEMANELAFGISTLHIRAKRDAIEEKYRTLRKVATTILGEQDRSFPTAIAPQSLFLMEWDENVGPVVIDQITLAQLLDGKHEIDLEQLANQIFMSSTAIYGGFGDTAQSFVVIPILRLNLFAYTLFAGYEDASVRGGTRPFALVVLSPKVDDIHEQLIETTFARHAQNYKHEKRINLQAVLEILQEGVTSGSVTF